MTATPTFSQSITGSGVGANTFGPAANNYLVPDTTVDGICLVNAGGQAAAVQQGSAVLAKGPDGALHWYRIRGAGTGSQGTTTHPVLEYIGP